MHESPVTGIEKEFVVPGANETEVEVESPDPYVKLTYVIVLLPEKIEPLRFALVTATEEAATVLTLGLHVVVVKELCEPTVEPLYAT